MLKHLLTIECPGLASKKQRTLVLVQGKGHGVMLLIGRSFPDDQMLWRYVPDVDIWHYQE